jgi:hypothetical protein
MYVINLRNSLPQIGSRYDRVIPHFSETIVAAEAEVADRAENAFDEGGKCGEQTAGSRLPLPFESPLKNTE